MNGHSHTYVDVVLDGEDRTFDLADVHSLSIGRHPQCSVVLSADPMASRRHALVQRQDSGDYYLSDLGSRNGTTHNGVPVTSPVRLEDGDSFTIGEHRFVFHRSSPMHDEEDDFHDPTDVLVVERMITILVLDIRNYTVLARELGEARITEVMNRLFHRAGELLKRNGSWAQKYIGDAVMAFWVHGDPERTQADLVKILDSLVGLGELIETLNAEHDLPRRLAYGAGINSGVAVTGNMGSAGLADHTAMGDAVNKAFRLESASKEVGREVVIGASTFELMGDLGDVGRGFSEYSLDLKGYDEPEIAHALTAADLPSVVSALRDRLGG